MKTKTKLASTVFLLAAMVGARAQTAWELQPSGSTAGLRGIHAVGDGIVWASGTEGTVLRSADGGSHWQHCSNPPDGAKLDFRGIWAWNGQTALLMSSGPGDQSRLFRTSDGCRSWRLLLTNPDGAGGFWDGILFLDRFHGFIYGDPVSSGARIPCVETQDGGNTWRPAPMVQPLRGESVFAASNSAMAATQGWMWLGTSRARVLRTRTFAIWQSAQTPLASGNESSGVFSLAFRDQQHGVAVGGDYRRPNVATGNAAYSSDGGQHWNAAGKPPHGYRSAVAWDATHQAWITAGSNGSDISYDDGKTWQWLDSGNWNALSLPWAVGPNGQIGKLGSLPAGPEAATGVSR